MKTKSKCDYQIFRAEDNFETWGPRFLEIVSNIPADYFTQNPRFNSLGDVSSARMVDYMGIYEEGDGWILTILEASIPGLARYLFLPLAMEIPPDNRNPELGEPAFGLETESAFYGKRQWQVFDAFADWNFHKKLFYLFLPLEGISENHVNALLQVHHSGIGQFNFISKYQLSESFDRAFRQELEFAKTGVSLKFDGFILEIPQTLPEGVDFKALEESPDVVGWIDYSGEQELHLVVGVLYRYSE